MKNDYQQRLIEILDEFGTYHTEYDTDKKYDKVLSDMFYIIFNLLKESLPPTEKKTGDFEYWKGWNDAINQTYINIIKKIDYK